MKKIFKLLKIVLIPTLIGLFLSFSITNFLHSKMNAEVETYYKLLNDMKHLNDVYSLCNGLLTTNPSKVNMASCNLVYKNIEGKVNEIKEECPYISFYTEYISRVQ